MRNLLTLSITGFVLFFVTGSIFAQTGNPLGYEKICLKAERIIIKDGEKTIRKRKLTGTGFPVGKTIYIVSITQSKAGQIITTGDQSADTDLAPFGAKYVAGVMKYLEGQAKMTSADGSINVVVNAVPSYEPARHTPAQYFGVFGKEPQPIVGEQATGTEGGLQQGPLTLEQLFSPSATSDCASIQWDPEGRVFDANTLEPMENVVVTILDSTKKPVNQAGVKNPDNTDILGIYTFYVEEGDYYLSVKPPSGFTLPSSESQIHKNFTRAYYNLYKKDEVIIERIDTPEEEAQGYPNVEHRDIPLYSTTAKTIRPFNVLAHTEIAAADGTVYSGQTTHPLSKVILKQGGQVIYEKEADKYGAYSFPIESALIDPQAPVDITFEKTDLTSESLTFLDHIKQQLFGVVFAQQKSITIRTQPILQSIKGTAFDKDGNTIPYSIVNIKLTSNDAIAIQTKADNEGKFSIPDGTAPTLPYYFEFIDPLTNIQTRKETSEFSVNNQIVDLYDKQKAQANIKQRNDTVIPTLTPKIQEPIKAGSPEVLILVAVIAVLTMGAIMTFFILRNKKQQQPFNN
jgi:hypothetical protein